MASPITYQFAGHMHADMILIDGYVQTDASGKVKNQASGLDALTDGYLDAWGGAQVLPRGIDSISLDGSVAGLYHVHLTESYHKISHVSVTLVDKTKTGTLSVLQFNPQGSDVAGGASAQTIDVQYREGGSAHTMLSSGFTIHIRLRNSEGV